MKVMLKIVKLVLFTTLYPSDPKQYKQCKSDLELKL